MNRKRIRDLIVNPTNGTYIQDTWSKSSCSVAAAWTTIQNVAYNSGKIGSYEVMNDVLVTDYHRRSKAGEVFFNSMDRCKMIIDPGYGQSLGVWKQTLFTCDAPNAYQQHWRSNIQGSHSFGRKFSGFAFTLGPNGDLLHPASLVSAGDLDAAVTEASTACLSERGRSHINLFETLAEVDKTLGLVHGAIQEMTKIVTSKKGRRILGPASGAAGLWLSYRYGLKPLMQDVEGLLEGIQKKTGKVRQTSRGNVKLTRSSVSSAPQTIYSTWTGTNTHRFTEEYDIRAMSLDEFIASTQFNLGFSAKDRMTLFWELIPYSFVLDWAANIGDYIGALAPAFGFTQLGSCVVVKRNYVDDFTLSGFVISGSSYTAVTVPPQMGCNMKFTSTTRYPGLAEPGLVIRDSFKLQNIIRAADAISLLVKRLR